MMKLYNGNSLIAENEVIFSFEPKLKNNSFRKWLNFNFNDFEFSPKKKNKYKKNDKNLKNPSNFIKIHITVIKINFDEKNNENDNELNTNSNNNNDLLELDDLPKAKLKSDKYEDENKEDSLLKNDSDKDNENLVPEVDDIIQDNNINKKNNSKIKN